MESIDLEMEDLFDQEAGEDEDIGAHVLHPEMDDDEDRPMRSGEEGNEEDDEGVVANLQRLSKGAAKKKVMRPQPKLDVERLKSERGLAVLPELFKDVKFKGKGYEAQDLKLIMNKLEHWAHRLYPIATFDQFIEKLEKLGTKKPVQTLLKRIRLDMPILDNDFVAQYDDDEDNDQVAPPTDNKAIEEEMDDVDAEEAFEAMLRQEREKTKQMQSDKSDDIFLNESTKSPELTVSKSQSSINDDISNSLDTPERMAPEMSVPETEREITLDIKQRIEENRRKALLKRAAKLGVPVESLLSPKKDGQVNQSQETHKRDGSQLSNTQQKVDNVSDLLDTQSQANSLLSSQADSQLTSQVLGSELTIPSEVTSQKASQSEGCSFLPSELDTQSPNNSPNTTEKNNTNTVEDRKTEQELMNMLQDDDDDDDFSNSKMSSNQQTSEVETMQISSKEDLNLQTKNVTLDDNAAEANASKGIVLSDGNNLNLQLDMSTSDAVDTEEGDSLTLHMDLSVNEGTEN